MGFVTVAAFLALAATGWVVWPLVRHQGGASDEATQARAALAVLRERAGTAPAEAAARKTITKTDTAENTLRFIQKTSYKINYKSG